MAQLVRCVQVLRCTSRRLPHGEIEEETKALEPHHRFGEKARGTTVDLKYDY